MILSGEKVDNYIPKNALDVYSREESLGRQAMSRDFHETAILSRLRMFGENYYNSLPDSGGGLGSRLYKAAHEEATLDGILAAVKTKRYALSRIRRMCLCAALGVKKGAADGTPPYARVLAANSRRLRISARSEQRSDDTRHNKARRGADTVRGTRAGV